MNPCAETIIEAMAELPAHECERLSAAFGNERYEPPRNWRRVPHQLVVECDGDCGAAEEARNEVSSLEYQIDDLEHERDRMEDERDRMEETVQEMTALLRLVQSSCHAYPTEIDDLLGSN